MISFFVTLFSAIQKFFKHEELLNLESQAIHRHDLAEKVILLYQKYFPSSPS